MADKLGRVPVPNMADGIWAGIERQLDVVAGTPAKKTFLKYKGGTGYIFIGIIAIVALLFILWWYNSRKNNAPKNTPASKTLPVIKQLMPVKDSIKLNSGIKKKNIPLAPVTIKAEPVPPEKDTLLLHQIMNSDVMGDSGAKQNLPPVKVDSPHFNPVMIKPHGKKPKGVKGITSEDYRISVKKDSIK